MKNRVLMLLSFLLLCFVITGCAPTQMYYYGNYSQTLYTLQKEMNEDSQGKHVAELEKIISGSEKRNLPVPPGINAELGYFYYKTGIPVKALHLFRQESELYPESRPFMERLISNLELAEENQGQKEISN